VSTHAECHRLLRIELTLFRLDLSETDRTTNTRRTAKYSQYHRGPQRIAVLRVLTIPQRSAKYSGYRRESTQGTAEYSGYRRVLRVPQSTQGTAEDRRVPQRTAGHRRGAHRDEVADVLRRRHRRRRLRRHLRAACGGTISATKGRVRATRGRSARRAIRVLKGAAARKGVCCGGTCTLGYSTAPCGASKAEGTLGYSHLGRAGVLWSTLRCSAVHWGTPGVLWGTLGCRRVR
jgi:hypothetical protein